MIDTQTFMTIVNTWYIILLFLAIGGGAIFILNKKAGKRRK